MSALERRITVTAVVLPFLGFLAAVALLWGGGVTALDLEILAVMYVLVGFGVTVGFHRLLTHRSFEAQPWVRATLAALGSMSVQGAVIHWVADHRKHHAFTDEEGDPHSPHTEGGHPRGGGAPRTPPRGGGVGGGGASPGASGRRTGSASPPEGTARGGAATPAT